MREIVFQVASFPLATVNLQAEQINTMSAGDTRMQTYDAVVDLHGIEATVSVEVMVTALKNGGLLVSLARPLIINAGTFGLADSVEQLREIAGLPSINNNVMVDFTLQFDAD